ncbi:MAG: hypothetical protein J6Q85_04095 [Clostridia bacterium]|nr:hypothetical protein [Clostridia bacterium]
METKTITNERVYRFGEFELMKAFAILGLPIVHLLEEGINENYVSADVHKLEAFIVALCIVGPSIFMMCMGFGIGGTRNTPRGMMKQGLRFLALGAILNLIRWILPGLLLFLVHGISMSEDIFYFFASDIYYFVGFFYLFYALMLKLKLTTSEILVATIVMLTINTLLTPLMSDVITNYYLIGIIGNIVYIDGTSCFPLLSWAVFPTVGIFLGDVLKKVTDEKRGVIMKRMLIFAPVIFISYLVSLSIYGHDVMKVMVSPLNDYITDLPNVILMISLALFFFAALYYVSNWIDETKFMKFMMKISTHIVPFYMLQWILVSWVFFGMDLFECEEGVLTLPWFIIAAVLVTGICIYVVVKHGMKATKFLVRMVSFRRKKRKVVQK